MSSSRSIKKKVLKKSKFFHVLYTLIYGKIPDLTVRFWQPQLTVFYRKLGTVFVLFCFVVVFCLQCTILNKKITPNSQKLKPLVAVL